MLFTIPLIGTHSSQGMPDPDHKIIPNLHNFTYDVYFYGSNLALSEVLEFDINQFFDGMGFIYGHQCEIAAAAISGISGTTSTNTGTTLELPAIRSATAGII